MSSPSTGPRGTIPDSVVTAIRRNAATRKEVLRLRKQLLAILRDTPTIAADAKTYGVVESLAKRIAAGHAYKRVPMPARSRRLAEVW